MATLGIINYGAFLIAAVLLNLTPGVDTLYVLGRSITGGTRVGIVSALGISTGLFVHTILVSMGLSVVLMSSEWLFWGLKVLGAAYLVYLGIRALLSKQSSFTLNPRASQEEQDSQQAQNLQMSQKPLRNQEEHSQKPQKVPKIQKSENGSKAHSGAGLGHSYIQGVITNVANPKIALFFLAFLPQFVDPATSFAALPFLLLGLSFIITSTIWSCILALGAGQFKKLLDKRPRISTIVNRGSGVLYIILGISIFATPMPE